MEKVYNLMNIFEKEGYEIYIVGGFVRDKFLNLKTDIIDIDLTTNATQEEKEKILSKYNIPFKTVGRAFSVAIVSIDSIDIDIATYRKRDKGKTSGDKDITDNIIEDLKRRDFTMNTLLMNSKGEIIDFIGAIESIEAREIKAIGVADERIKEDALRIMRAYRFAAQKDFKLNSDLKKSCRKNRKLLKDISIDRIGLEINKILKSKKPEILIDMIQDDIFEYICKDLHNIKHYNQNNKYHYENLDEHTRTVIKNVSLENNFILNTAALLHDIGKVKTKKIKEDGFYSFINHEEESAKIIKESNIREILGLSKKELDLVYKLVLFHGKYTSKPKHILNLLKNNFNIDEIELLIKLQKADTKAHKNNKERLVILKELEEELNYTKENRPLSLRDLNISGNDLIELGIENNKIGKVLDELFTLSFYNNILNNKIKLTELAERLK